MEHQRNNTLEASYRPARLGEWFDIYKTFMRTAEKNSLFSQCSLVNIAKNIRLFIRLGLVVVVYRADQKIGYVGAGVTQGWWMRRFLLTELFVLGLQPGFGYVAHNLLISLAKQNNCSMIQAGNVLSIDKQLTTNGYLKDGFSKYDGFYKEIS